MLPDNTRNKATFNSHPQSRIGQKAMQAQSGRTSGRVGPLQCPHCHEHGISRTKKLLLGPVFTCQCTACGGRWRISKWSVAVALISILIAPVLLILGWVTHILAVGGGSVIEVGFVVSALAALTILYVVPVRRVGPSPMWAFSNRGTL